ncbi:MAG: 23S rRNA (uracil(1939)-C(5))-methyltransferase RlmD [Endomicrobium sp.]|jgi:23S rRNA (uracil-5-)-methyltransferase RumA|nr:23S rRNA (uracil(1939)-C(5))-methyltransferase RlmD [Endomicrobium sp.]
MSLKNKIISVKAEKIIFPGRSLCRCEDGIALFAEGVLPGETADVLVIKDKKSFREGVIKRIVQKSDERIEPLCSSFGSCGGCAFQNTDYENQVKYKKGYIDELLNIFGVEIGSILQSTEIWNYRNKMEFSFFNGEGITDLGLHCRGSFNKYISIPPCYIADKDFIKAAQIVKDFANKNGIAAYDNKTHEGFFRHLVLRKAKNNNQLLINIVTNVLEGSHAFFEPLVKKLRDFVQSVYWTQNASRSDAVVLDKLTLLLGKENITEKLTVGNRDFYFNVSPFSFFQTNSKGAEMLYNEVLRQLSPSKEDILLDLYCGTGTIGICMSHRVKKVTGIEQSASAIENAKTNALLNNAVNAEFFASTVEKWVKENNLAFDAIIVDPPRSGLTNDIIKFLLGSQARKIIYVSCNPSTLARDLALMTASGRYAVKIITPTDMFPQTYHMESVVSLEKI